MSRLTSRARAAFLLALVMRGTAFEPYVSYVDPLLVILLVIVTLPIPSKMALQGVGQLLNVAPETAEQAEVRRQVEAALDGMEIEATSIRMAHIGRFFYVAVYVVVAPTTALGTAADLDAVRTRVNDRLREHRPALVLDVVFTVSAFEPL